MILSLRARFTKGLAEQSIVRASCLAHQKKRPPEGGRVVLRGCGLMPVQRLNTYSIDVFCMSLSSGLFEIMSKSFLFPMRMATYCLPLTA